MNEDVGKEPKPLVRKLAVGVLGLLSLTWIFIPEPTDLVPVLGWLDEAAAAGIFLACLSYLGVDVTRWKTLFNKGDLARQEKGNPAEKSVSGRVVDE